MIELYSASSNLGDNLSLTPLMHQTQCRVHLFDDASVKSVAPIFDGLAEVVFDNKGPIASPESNVRGPHSKKTLVYFGYPNASAIPKINLTEKEISWARKYLEDMQITNGCIVKASTQQINYRTPPDGLMQMIVDSNPSFQFLTSGLSTKHPKNNFSNIPLKNVMTMWDYPIRSLAAIYSIIGRYVGPDTGDYHLMLAVGGKATVLVPESAWHYSHENFHYNEECWIDEEPRVSYHHWMDNSAYFIK
jgi:hypothetical protein